MVEEFSTIGAEAAEYRQRLERLTARHGRRVTEAQLFLAGVPIWWAARQGWLRRAPPLSRWLDQAWEVTLP